MSQVAVDSSLDDAFEPLLRGEQAVLVIDDEKPVAVITRADLLDFVAHRGRG
jgi:predicted transcriptional regulator